MIEPRAEPAGALERLTSVSRALTYAASLEEALEITVETAQSLLEAPRAVLMLPDEEGLLYIRAARGVDDDVVERFREPLDENLVFRLSSVFGPGAHDRFLGVPLVVRGGITGLLAVLLPEGRQVENRDEWLLSALADQASVALEGERREQTAATMEERVRELEQQALRQEDALRMVGHDLRSPLNSMRGYLHLLRTGMFGEMNDGQRSAIDRLDTLVCHLDSLVGNALEMSLLRSGQVTVQIATVQLGSVVEESMNVVAFPAQEAGVELRREIPEDLVVEADGKRVRQVLVQLLDNAIKFSPRDGTVRIGAEREPGPPERVVIRVRDQGPGIDPVDVEYIFQPYHRLGGARSGYGLGLAIARAVTDLMNGTLEVEQEDRPGATFALRLPAA